MVQVSDCSHKSLKGHEAPVLTVALDPDEEFLVTKLFLHVLIIFPSALGNSVKLRSNYSKSSNQVPHKSKSIC